MVSWSARRQFTYIAGAMLVFIFALALPIFFVTYRAPSCTDGVKNQGEFGVDCGGPCALLCKANALDLIIHWQRAFKVKDGVYNVLAYVENPNLDSGIAVIPYDFKLYDKDNLLIYERHGQTFVPPRKIFGIFESDIITDKRLPTHTFFEFLGVPAWKKSRTLEPVLTFSNQLISRTDSAPRLAANINNPGLSPVYNTEVVAILYDASNNAVASSRTIIDKVPATGFASLVFTWPESFSAPVSRTELLYRLLR